MLNRIYVWEFPVRLTHWLNVISILALLLTGFYIGAPFIHAARENQLIMATMRFLHFVSSYVFTVSVLVRIYWWFAGNRYARLNQFIPASSERQKDLIDSLLFYVFLRKDSTHAEGHNALYSLHSGDSYGFCPLRRKPCGCILDPHGRLAFVYILNRNGKAGPSPINVDNSPIYYCARLSLLVGQLG